MSATGAPAAAARKRLVRVSIYDDLIASPTMALDTDGFLIDKSIVDHRLNSGQNTIERAFARIADTVSNIGL